MFAFKVNEFELVSPHGQVTGELRRAIEESEIGQSERLPFAMDRAAVLTVNKDTVIRMSRDARREGLSDVT